ncbi:glycoside hydrolase family 88 protein [Gilvimarinus agarilyticus]|uniref:glycoside hydrolase family 88/105 protein n=1 Tax=Gilvimarinus sp. 2_MG-2023 TaxID=3062666 RepID=UPI001C0815A1|nr:glycoside hydrolase family 88 protein [Gilvimarinus sp. 2_MG-2023]MBU2886716.1 glycoside hydrolase family 88 protein [Gilvimarinus agarilyticus]MDO6571382.1 glycoside hydrolase family 88 protein [Gilvimarinus sp. 2_MG-2023]
MFLKPFSALLAGMVACGCATAEIDQSQGLAWPELVEYKKPGTTDIALSAELSRSAVSQIANQVADWQLDQYDIRSNKMRPEGRASGLPQGWMYAPLHSGLLDWARVSGQPAYEQAVRNIAAVNLWRLGPRRYHADDHAIGQVYLDLYETYQEPVMKENIEVVFDWVLEHQSDRDLAFEHPEKEVIHGANRKYVDPWCTVRWCWADAIFMAPPVWAQLAEITGKDKYLEFMNREFWVTTDYLYSEEDQLFLRDSRYFTRKADNGKPIYWGRGNGWVLAGIARTLPHIPQDFSDREKYVQLYKEISESLLKAQKSDGSWPASLLEISDTQNPESSATGLIVFALAWGINNDVLPADEYRPAVEKGWKSLVSTVQPNGKLGFVQQVGYAPESATAEDTQLYGTGALLLAAAEVYQLLEK